MVTPRLAISTQSDPLMSLDGWRYACGAAGIDNLDLDISNRFKQHVLSRSLQTKAFQPEARSIWIGGNINPKLELRAAALIILPEQLLLKSQGGDDSLFRLLDRVKSVLGDLPEIAVALTARNREGNRAHLNRISNIRHIAEEWDLGIALDLTKDIDANWEAEAAVMRLGDRLRIVRFTAPSEDGPFPLFGRPVDHITVRALSWLAESGFAGTLSMKLSLHCWNWSDPAAAASEAVRVGTAVLSKFAISRSETPHPPRRVI